jgi:hypothetical protein
LVDNLPHQTEIIGRDGVKQHLSMLRFSGFHRPHDADPRQHSRAAQLGDQGLASIAAIRYQPLAGAHSGRRKIWPDICTALAAS